MLFCEASWASERNHLKEDAFVWLLNRAIMEVAIVGELVLFRCNGMNLLKSTWRSAEALWARF